MEESVDVGAGPGDPAGTTRSSGNLADTKVWTTPGNRKLSLDQRGVILNNNTKTQIRVKVSGVEVYSEGDLELSGDELIWGHAGRRLEFKARNYLWLSCGESGLLLLPDQIQMSADELYLGSYRNEAHPVLEEGSAEEILLQYEEAKAYLPPLIAPDGSIVRREGYEDILHEDALYEYFLNEVLDKQKDYMRPLGDEPIPTMFQMWLDNTYGKTRLGQFWEYMSTIDGIQTLLDLGGFFWDGFDAINCVIYLIRGKYEDAAWSALGAIPFCGSLLSKGARKAASALSGTLPKAIRLLDEGGAIVKALGLTIEVSPQMLGKFEKLMKGFEDAAQYAASLKGKVRYYFEGVDGIEDLNIIVKVQDEAGDGVHYAFKYGDDVAEGFSDTARVADDVIEGGSNTIITPDMEAKILEGQRVANSNRVIGGHSPQINNVNPNMRQK